MNKYTQSAKVYLILPILLVMLSVLALACKRDRLAQKIAKEPISAQASSQNHLDSNGLASSNLSSNTGKISQDEQQRVMAAGTLHTKFQMRGQLMIVEATGKEYRTFRIAWPEGKVDKEHAEGLKKATPFHQDLRSRGFTHLIMQDGEKTFWSKDF